MEPRSPPTSWGCRSNRTISVGKGHIPRSKAAPIAPILPGVGHAPVGVVSGPEPGLTVEGFAMDAPRRQFMLATTVLACSGLPFAGCDDGGGGGSLPLREIEATNKRVDALERWVAELGARVAGGTKGANPEASDAARNNP